MAYGNSAKVVMKVGSVGKLTSWEGSSAGLMSTIVPSLGVPQARGKGSVPPRPLDVDLFPHQPKTPIHSLPCTIQNMEHLLEGYRISAKYDVIRKFTEIKIPLLNASDENSAAVSLSNISSLATLNGMSTQKVKEYLDAISDQNRFNPVSDWVFSRPWDGNDRLKEFYDTLIERDGYPKQLKETLIFRWLLSAVAAALEPSGFRCRGVLTLQGPQAIGKTSWVSSLVPRELRRRLLKLGHHLDPSNKDTQITAICHWIVEIGELDSSLKKDIARLKGFITDTTDKIRRVYASADSEYPRRTVFCASVNDAAFLVDQTGNSRWWTIAVTGVRHEHEIDMQQLFAQVAGLYKGGEQWWLTSEEEALLTAQNMNYVVVNAINAALTDAIDLERVGEEGLPAMTPTMLLQALRYDRPTNTQCKDTAAFLRMNIGESKRIKGRDMWRIPLRQDLADAVSGNFTMAPSSRHVPSNPGRADADF